jgi:tetratricopeptide (TPR) repeat protein
MADEGNCRHFALLELGRETEAIEWLNKLLEKHPSNGNYYDAACIYSHMNKSHEALKNIILAFENGFRDIAHLNNDNDLKNVRENSDFKSVVDNWKTTIEEQNKLELKKQNDKNLIM